MNVQTVLPAPDEVVYPDSDGQPMAETERQAAQARAAELAARLRALGIDPDQP